jgi:hypothetical protein
MVARVMVDVCHSLTILFGLEAQHVVVVMALPDLVDGCVLDLLQQGLHRMARHERHRRLQLQQEQEQGEPASEHQGIV